MCLCWQQTGSKVLPQLASSAAAVLAINCSCGLQVFMVPADAKLDEETMTKIYRSGHSRIPVHKVGRRWGCVG